MRLRRHSTRRGGGIRRTAGGWIGVVPGERIADQVTRLFGSWRFIIVETVIVMVWILVNLLRVAYRWDPYPFFCSTCCSPRGPRMPPR
jgi:uncharacterized protein DUF1003